ncbi:hypothetical protein A2768_01910 [Candidatus Roizmanbacteria bacterium RIFCSPHIGHO2_01_FULL_37_16]|nr:MAG: hypothetical protein A2768_01910 [Candidatus Roizmanbacteria bacterium RIFCSPHIGHO2_01_FULL_37_16]
MQPLTFTLSNGLRVVLIDTKAFPTLTTIVLFGAGSRYENEKNNGIAHFFEHIPFKGTKKYPSAFAISSLFEGMGAVNNAFTSKDHTGYWVKGTTKHFEKILDILADMIIQPLLKPEEIEREKGVIVEEINMYEDSPGRKIADIFENLLYKGSALGMDTTGTKETVTKFTRQTFLDYMEKMYSPKNAVLVVAGGLNPKQNYNVIIEKIFAKWVPVNPEGSQARFAQVLEKQSKSEMLIKHKKTEQTHFSLGYRTFSFRDPRKYAQSILTTILGGGMSSRLFIEVRERRGLCYYIHTGKEAYHDVGYITTMAGVTNDHSKIKEAVSVILAEHKKIADGKVGDDEIKRAKEMIKGRILLSMEDSSNVASWYGTKLILENKLETVEEVLNKLEKVGKEELIRLAKEIVKPERLNLALIGPFEKGDFSGILD